MGVKAGVPCPSRKAPRPQTLLASRSRAKGRVWAQFLKSAGPVSGEGKTLVADHVPWLASLSSPFSAVTCPYGSCISIRSACRSRPGGGSGLVQAPFFLQWRSGLVRASEQVAFAFLAGAVWVGCCLAPPARCLAGFSCAPW